MRHTTTSMPAPSFATKLVQCLVLVVLLTLSATAFTASPASAAIPEPREERPDPELVDPAGIVYDQTQYAAAKAAGRSDAQARGAAAIEGAKVALQRKVGGEFRDVRSNDPGITPAKAAQVTGENGRYAWFVTEGDYRVVVSIDGYATATSAGVHVPPAVTDLHVALTKTAVKAGASMLPSGLAIAAGAVLLLLLATRFGRTAGRSPLADMAVGTARR